MLTPASTRTSNRATLLASAALGLVVAYAFAPDMSIGGGTAAYAQSDQGHGAGRQGGGGSRGGQGANAPSSTHGAGQSSQGASAPTSAASPSSGSSNQGSGQAVSRGHYGQGGSTGEETNDGSTSEDKKGPRYGGSEDSRKPTAGTTGGRPVWAKEGIPEVELGRLSVARAPASVLQHAFDEVKTNWTATGSTVMTLTAVGQPTLTMTVAQLYSLPATEFARVVQTYYDSIVRIDSPLENLSLLKDVRTTNSTVLTGVTPSSPIDLAAIFLGSASDKTIPISNDTVTAINTILQLPPLTTAQTAEMAVKADAVRQAISTGHGE